MITKMSLMWLFFISVMSFCWYQVSMASYCIKEERESLLKFKASFIEPLNQLGSWNGTDCCSWDGVGCDHTNDHVLKLDLRNYGYPFSSALIANGVDSSLFELKHLNHLDLSANCFNYTQIPKYLSSMLQLRYLNLSDACFTGAVPRALGNLTMLRFLDLKSLDASPGSFNYKRMFSDDLGWVSSLSSLEYLDLSWVKVQSNLDMVQLFYSLPNSLLILKLMRCGLQNNYHLVSPPLNSSLLSKLQHLDLCYNMLHGPISVFLTNMTSLKFLYLNRNRFTSSIPLWMGKMNLVELNLGYNRFASFEGGLSSIIRNNRHLKKFSLTYNFYLGDVFGSDDNSSLGYSDMENLQLGEIKFGACTIPNWLGQLKNLKFLNLKSNLLYGPIPSSFGNLSSLEHMDISHNMLTGGIPTSFGKLSNLSSLILRENKLEGVIPESLGQLQRLKELDFSNNALRGVISEIHFVKLSRLVNMFMDENRLLSFEIKHNWVPPFQLETLSLGSIMGFGTTEFPRWIGTQTEQLSHLNLSNTKIVGPMPTWLTSLRLSFLDLSYNKITGSLPKNIDEQLFGLEELYISDAHISGSLPHSLCKLGNLMVLAISNNRLSKTIPSCLSTLDLNILDLSSNQFSGGFPSSFRDLSNLKVLNLAKNRLVGEPLTTMKSFKSLLVLDLEGNQFSGNIPTWVGYSLESLQILNLRDNMFNGTLPSTLWLLPHLQILILAGNKFVGNIPPNVGNFSANLKRITDNWLLCNTTKNPYAVCYESYVEQVMKSSNLKYSYLRLYSMVNIDLSNNNLCGKIPSEMTTVKGLYGLNLSHNNLSGTIPVDIGRLVSLESLDLSFNKLSGPIPNSMSSLSSLGVLKLSNNNFSGRIPREGHLSTFNDASSYEGNPYLCGEPLSVKCSNGNSREPLAEVDNFGDNSSDEEDKFEKMWFYIFVMVGYGLGFWGVVGTLIWKRRWRYAYFQFMDETKDRIHVAILVNMTRLKY